MPRIKHKTKRVTCPVCYRRVMAGVTIYTHKETSKGKVCEGSGLHWSKGIGEAYPEWK
jgi:hypothetical protein